jgi:hypothetical protein
LTPTPCIQIEKGPETGLNPTKYPGLKNANGQKNSRHQKLIIMNLAPSDNHSSTLSGSPSRSLSISTSLSRLSLLAPRLFDKLIDRDSASRFFQLLFLSSEEDEGEDEREEEWFVIKLPNVLLRRRDEMSTVDY